MSYSSRAVKRLQYLYNVVFKRMKANEWLYEHGLFGRTRNVSRPISALEQLEPRMMLSVNLAIDGTSTIPTFANVKLNETYSVTATAALDAGETVDQWEVDWGDGNGYVEIQGTDAEMELQHLFLPSDYEAGYYDIWVRVTDSDQDSDVMKHRICIVDAVDKSFYQEGNENERLGSSVAMSGDFAIAGAPTAGENNEGKVCIYKYDAGTYKWVAEQTINGAVVDGNFGLAVAISGDNLFISGKDADGKGQVYWYTYNSSESEWEYESIIGTGAFVADRFGESLAVEGDYLVIAAPGTNDGQGSAFVYQYDQYTESWGYLTTLTAGANTEDGVEFGYSVDISTDTAIPANNTIVVGSRYENDNSGAVYIFTKDQGGTDNWGEIKRLTPQDEIIGQVGSNNYFNSVAIGKLSHFFGLNF